MLTISAYRSLGGASKVAHSINRRALAFALAVALPVTSAVAAPTAGADGISPSGEIANENVEGFPPEFYDAIDRAALATTPEEVAEALFPDDPVSQAAILPDLREIQRIQYMESEGPSIQALPVALVPFAAVVAGCVAGALGGVVVGDLVSQIRHGHRLEAEARVDTVISGCITTGVPPALRPIANAAKVPLRNAVLAVMVRWYQIT